MAVAELDINRGTTVSYAAHDGALKQQGSVAGVRRRTAAAPLPARRHHTPGRCESASAVPSRR